VEGASTLAALPMSPDAARALKLSAKAALVVVPQWPHYATGIKNWGPRIDRPTDIREEISVVVADFSARCCSMPRIRWWVPSQQNDPARLAAELSQPWSPEAADELSRSGHSSGVVAPDVDRM
jgi:hypothetical protein